MSRVFAAIFLFLHALVHLLYAGQAARRFELQPGLTWPDGSWALSRLGGEPGARQLAIIGCILAAAGLILGAAGLILGQSWWTATVVASAGFSALIFTLLWNGQRKDLASQGTVGLLIDLAIIVVVLVFHWPVVDS